MASAGPALSDGQCHGVPPAIGNRSKGQSEIRGLCLGCGNKSPKLWRPENVIVYLQGVRSEEHSIMQALGASGLRLG